MTESQWLHDAEARAWRGHLRMTTLLGAQISRDLHKSDLSDADYTVLSNLSEVDEHCWRLRDLAERMLWSTSRLSHHIRRMEQRGLVERSDCADDGRGTEVVLTDSGMRTIEQAAPHHVASVRRHLFDALTRDQIEQLGAIAEAVVSHLTDAPKQR